MLGLVSLFMDTSSELIHSLLPVFLVGTLGASAAAVGLIEGVAEATALVTKVFSGVLSDWFGRRKLLAVIGYGLAALTKPFFALATTVEAVVLARFMDRIGKGIRGAPRDALVADLVPPEIRGAAFGLRQSLDTIGAVLGPLLAIAAMALFAGDIRLVFWLAVPPAFIAVALLALGVEEPAATATARPPRTPIRRAELGQLTRAYWTVVGLGAVLTLATGGATGNEVLPAGGTSNAADALTKLRTSVGASGIVRQARLDVRDGLASRADAVNQLVVQLGYTPQEAETLIGTVTQIQAAAANVPA